MKKWKRMITLLLCLGLLLTAGPWGAVQARAEERPVNPFADVKETDYFYVPVQWAVKQGITGGTSADRFSPRKDCTRAQAVSFLWAAAGRPEPRSGANPFTDVKEKDYYYKAVLWACEKGITKGITETAFGPRKSCTRAQVVSFLWAAAGKPEPQAGENPFTDVKETNYYYKAVLWAYETGITKGITESAFGPRKSCTRAQAVSFLWVCADRPDPMSPTGRSLVVDWKGEINLFNRTGQALYHAAELGLEQMPFWDRDTLADGPDTVTVPDDGLLRADVQGAEYVSVHGRDFFAALLEHRGVSSLQVSQTGEIALGGGEMSFRLLLPANPGEEGEALYLTLSGSAAEEARISLLGQKELRLQGLGSELFVQVRSFVEENFFRARITGLPADCLLYLRQGEDGGLYLAAENPEGGVPEGLVITVLP